MEEEPFLQHYGVLRRSGRYPWGTSGWGAGEMPDSSEQNSRNFLAYIKSLFSKGMSEKEVAEGLGCSTTELRAAKSIAVNEVRVADINMARRLNERGWGHTAAAERMGIPESTYRGYLKPDAERKSTALVNTANALRDMVERKELVDFGSGVENQLGVSSTQLNTAVAMLKEEGYEVRYLKERQIGTGEMTTYKILAPPGTSYAYVSQNRHKISNVDIASDDGGMTFLGMDHEPKSISPSRVGINYGPDGGAEADGVIYVRPGVEDIDLGGSRYAQVRIKVGDGHYLKGMAMYKDDLPDGVDLVFNTNKNDTGNKLDAMKKLNDDPENPFGAQIKRQLVTRDADGNEVVTSVMNIVNEEGDWIDWTPSVSAQMLSKQKPTLAQEQLKITYERKANELKEIESLTNPTVKQKLLEDFAEGADASAVHLKAAALPRQSWNVVLPLKDIPETQIYAPTFKDGESVALIRYPHGGTFEIPVLTVNNKFAEAKSTIGNARDAVGISPKTAQLLSGADFDGDTVLVIPNDRGTITSTKPLEQLKNFDPLSYKRETLGSTRKPMTEVGKQREMGDVSNLITDMTIQGAKMDEIARAVKHSMVVIDGAKHDLDYRQSAIDNGIKALKVKYQGRANAGASTLISRSGTSGAERVPKRKPRPYSEGGPIDPKTGKKVFVETGESYVNSKGKTVKRTEPVPKLALYDDVSPLSSGTRMEQVYVTHANRMKDLGNRARKSMLETPNLKYSPSAKKYYAKEVEELDAALNLAKMNRPRERQAQLVANIIFKAKKEAKPFMDKDEEKKIKSKALITARTRVGAQKPTIEITPKQWEAIQAGAISHSKLRDILDNADMEQVKSLATPRTRRAVSPAKLDRARALLDQGYTRAEVASSIGVPIGTLDDALYAE